nr:hypothetical protein Iba_chr14dCG6860 [Ipomoea batatas]
MYDEQPCFCFMFKTTSFMTLLIIHGSLRIFAKVARPTWAGWAWPWLYSATPGLTELGRGWAQPSLGRSNSVLDLISSGLIRNGSIYDLSITYIEHVGVIELVSQGPSGSSRLRVLY